MHTHANLPVRHGVVRDGFDFSLYSDRPRNPYGGLFHGWGPLAGGYQNPHVDMIMVSLPWSHIHENADPRALEAIDRQIDQIVAAGKKVYLYPHPAHPPAATGIDVADPRSGWIDFFEPASHAQQVAWCRWISSRYGRDPRITAIRMSSFAHGEAWCSGAPMQRLQAIAEGKRLSLAQAAEPYMRAIYDAYLAHADPHRLVAHGGGLQGSVLADAVRRGCGHANGTLLLDLGASHQFPRPEDAVFENGHLRVGPIARGIYCAERQTGEAWNLRGEAFDRWYIANLSIAITHRVNYLMLNECVYNAQPFVRLSDRARVSPDTTGRLTRRQEESAARWEPRPIHLEAATWARFLLGTDATNTPEAFVHLSRHYCQALGVTIEAVEHAMTLDTDRTPGVPTVEFDLSAGAEFQRALLGHRSSTFARRTDKRTGQDRFCFHLDRAFQKSLVGRSGELVEVRVMYLDCGFDGFTVAYPTAKGLEECDAVNLCNSGEWRTACFLLVDPSVSADAPFPIDVVSRGGGDLTIAMVRVIKQW